MSYLFFEKYIKQKKKLIYYNINELLILNILLGCLNKKGNKAWSLGTSIKIMFFLKTLSKKKPIKYLPKILNKVKPDIVLFNKKRGITLYELPRLLTIEQSNKKVIHWLIKEVRLKKKAIEVFLKEIEEISLNKGNLLIKRKNIIKIAEGNKAFFYMLKKK